jgi:hypothetical protein
MGTLSNFTLSKKQEMLDKSPIPEPLKETLLYSPLVKDKLLALAFLPVVKEAFLVADLLRYPEGFPEPFFIGPVSEWN